MEETEAIKLLAIDDKPDNLTTLSAVVRDALPQTHVLTATNGPTGIELAAAEDPDVILLDIVMPGMDGFEVCRRLKADDRIKDIPVVFLTALKTDAAGRVKALEAGAEGFLSKPLEPAELTAQIRAMTKVKAANRSQRTEKARLEALVAERTRTMRESEDRYRMAQAIGHVGSWEYNLQTTELWGSDEAKRIFGFDPEQPSFSIEEVEKCIPDRKRVHQALVDLIEADKPYNLEYEIHPRDGSEPRIIASVAELQRDEHGDPLRVTGVIQDITERKRAEEALRASEEKFRLIVDNSCDLIWILKPDGVFLYVSPSWELILGYEPSYMEGKAFQPFVHPEDVQACEDYLREAIDVRTSRSGIRYRAKHADGSWRWHEGTISPVYADDGSIMHFVGVSRDITDRKQAEEALRQAGDILKKMQMGLYVYELENPEDDSSLRMVAANAASGKLSGVSPEELIGKCIDEIFPALRALGIPKRFADIVRTGKTSEFEDFYYADDRVLEAAYAVKAFPLPNHRVGITFDSITERKRAEEALRENEERYRGIFDESVAPIYLFDNEQHFVDSNQAGLDLLGYSREELLRMSISDVDADPSIVLDAHQKLLHGGRLINYEHNLRRKDGFVITVLNNSKPLTDKQGNIVGMLSTLLGITERKQAEKQLAEQLHELQRWYNVMLDREGRVIELKREVNELLARADQPPRYPSAVVGGPDGMPGDSPPLKD